MFGDIYFFSIMLLLLLSYKFGGWESLRSVLVGLGIAYLILVVLNKMPP
jgi:hypothetical protein